MESDQEMIIYQKATFDAAHRLLDYDGNCGNLHGHTWTVEVWIEGVPDDSGMVFDYRSIKGYFKEKFDHLCILNEKDPLKAVIHPHTVILGNPTAENLAFIIRSDLGAVKVRVWESKENYAESVK